MSQDEGNTPETSTTTPTDTLSLNSNSIFTSIFWQKLNLGKKKFGQIFLGPKTFLVKIFGSEIFWAKKI